VAEVLLPFAGLLRGLRTEAGLTQEELAEAAGLTSRAISYLERGEVTMPHRETVRLLADALRLAGPGRAQFEAAARGRAGRAGANGAGAHQEAATRTLPRDVASFTGRQRELAELTDWVERTGGPESAGGVVSIHAIGGMAGIGKTAFAVHAAHRLAGKFPDGQIFFPLRGHTPGQQPAATADALVGLLTIIGVPAAQIPAGLEARMALWRDCVAGRRLLLILDDAVSSDQIAPLLPGSGSSLVLVTSRRHLSALEDATLISLDTLPPDQAAELLVRLTGRAGLSPQDPAVAELARLCGFLPLAIGMVARQLRHHPAWTAAGRAAELTAAADRLGLLATENLSVAAAFDLSYAGLTGDQRRLFRRLGLHPGTEIDGYAAAALDGTDRPAARRGLEELYDQYLLTEPVPGRYRLHDLIREHARNLGDRLDPGDDRDAATDRLLDYYQHTATRANGLIARLPRPASPAAAGPAPGPGPDLASREQALAWARAERTSLVACLDYATATARYARITALTAGLSGLLQRDGPWTEAIARHTTAAAAAQKLGDQLSHAGALNDLGTVWRLTCDFAAAAESMGQAHDIYRQAGSRLGEANCRESLGAVLRLTGDFPAAARAHEEALGLYRSIGDRLGQANALGSLGYVCSLMDDFPAAGQALEDALSIYRDLGDQLGQGEALNRLGQVRQQTGQGPAAIRAFREALDVYRDVGDQLGEATAHNNLGKVLQLTGDYPAAADALAEALDIYRQIGSRVGEANAHNNLGVVLKRTGEYRAAVQAQQRALEIYREVGERLGEANALNNLGSVLVLAGDYPPAAHALRQAMDIYRQIGNRLGEAEALNERGTLHRVSSEPALAEECHRQALELARANDGPWDEAQALAGLARCSLAAGRTAEGEAGLRQALAIFQRIGAAEAAEVAAELAARPAR
jgi:tetratricopeptide (TPR) repeat protein/transcriptional regulator with XRE-family HTH domain